MFFSGKKKNITENTNLWAVLTTDTFTPFIEFDFLGADAWALLGKTDAEVAEMGGGDKLELRKQHVSSQSIFSTSSMFIRSLIVVTYRRT